jgi:putative ABC transport system permease protein
VWRRKRLLEGLDDEMRDHLERETQDYIDRGYSPDEARRLARLKFGNVALAKEDARAVWVWGWAEQLIQDVRYALRTLRANRMFAGVVVATLAVAIGMNTAIFSVFNAVVLRPLGYPDADRLVWVSTVPRDGDGGAHGGFVTGPDFVDWRAQATSFERMAAYGVFDFTMTVPGRATRVRVAEVTEDFWPLSGARPTAGRLPQPDESDTVLVSSSFAQRWFADNDGAIGRTVTLNGRQVVVAGILPEDFRFELPRPGQPGFRTHDIEVYQPQRISSRRGGMMQLLHVVGRLRTGATIESARAEIDALRDREARAHPEGFRDPSVLVVTPLHDRLFGGASVALRVLMGAVGFVLLIACVNAASLHLARASARRREIALRMSIGASRGRVLRQILVESLVLAGLGGALGLLIARGATTALLRIAPHAIPRLADVTIDGRVLAVAAALSLVTALTFGLAPALTLWRTNPYEALKSGHPMVSPAASSLRTRRLLVAGEIALALILLIAAGLMVKSVWRMYAWPSGFAPQQVLTARIEFAGPEYANPHRSLAFADTLLDRLRREPGVEAVSLSTHGDMLAQGLIVDGAPMPTPEDLHAKPPLMINATSASLPRVMGLQLIRGRWFADGEAAAVLNESLARREIPGRDPIGRRIQINDRGPWLTIVGIVADLKYSQLDAAAEPEVYVPYSRIGDSLFGLTALIRTAGDPVTLAPRLHQIVADVDRTQAPDELMVLEDALAESIAPRRLHLLLLSTFAAAAIFVAMIGVYGVMAYSVAQRVHEIGIRMALGARRADVVSMVARQGLFITLAGIVAGLAGALALTRFMESLLYEVPPSDPPTFAVLAAGLAVTSAVACCIPALKAALVDPAVTLRSE